MSPISDSEREAYRRAIRFELNRMYQTWVVLAGPRPGDMVGAAMSPRHELEVDSQGQPRRRYVVDQPQDLRAALHHIHVTGHEYMQRGQPIDIRVRTMSKMTWRQQKRLNAMCGDMEKQAEWHGFRLNKDQWRALVVAVLRNDQLQVPGDEGRGFILLGGSSSDLSRKETSDAIELLYKLGADRNVQWTDPKRPPQ